jgi:putative ABC transport system substrate-binding protein
VLVNPAFAPTTETTLRDVQSAARTMGLQIQVLNASTSREIDAAFATFAHERPDAVFVGIDVFFNVRRAQLVNLASYHRVPAAFVNRDFSEIGGLMSYEATLQIRGVRSVSTLATFSRAPSRRTCRSCRRPSSS